MVDFSERSSIAEWGGDLGYGGGVSRGCVGEGGGQWGGDFSVSRGGYDCFADEGLLVDDGVESVDGVGGVLHSPLGAVWFDEGVATLDDISAAALVLGLGVSGQSVLDVVGVGVLWVWVVVVDDGFGGDGEWGGDLSVSWSGISGGGISWGGVGYRSVCGVGWGGVSQWGGDLGYWCGVCQGGGDLSVSRGGYDCLGDEGFLVDDGVESVDGVGGVVDGPPGAIGFGEGVGSVDDISITVFVLGLGVSGQSVLDVVGVGVLWVWVVFVGDGDFGGDGEWGGDLSVSWSGISWGGISWGGISWGGVRRCSISWCGISGGGVSWGCWEETSLRYSDESREDDELQQHNMINRFAINHMILLTRLYLTYL